MNHKSQTIKFQYHDNCKDLTNKQVLKWWHFGWRDRDTDTCLKHKKLQQSCQIILFIYSVIYWAMLTGWPVIEYVDQNTFIKDRECQCDERTVRHKTV